MELESVNYFNFSLIVFIIYEAFMTGMPSQRDGDMGLGNYIIHTASSL